MTFFNRLWACFAFPGTNTHLPESGPRAGADGSRADGDNLLGPLLPAAAARPTLLVDWPKALVGRAVFHGYTASGTSAPRPGTPVLSQGVGPGPSASAEPPLCTVTFWGHGALPACTRPSVDCGPRR